MAAVANFYRRVLPSPPAIEFASTGGKNLFSEALLEGNMEGFFKLISYYQTQSEPAYCGVATLAMVLNALAIDPGRKWKGPWRWFDDNMLDCCEPLEKVRGISEAGSGHFSPIGGFHAGKDMVLILDVARFKYPPHWVPLELLWDAMNTVDEATGLYRGFMLLSRLQRAPSILYTLSCRHDGWGTTAEYLTKTIPQLLSSGEINNIRDLLSVIFTSAPVNLNNFINWVAEVRKQEDGIELVSEEERGRLSIKEEILKQVRETELFKHVTRWLLSGSSNENFDVHDSLDKTVFEGCSHGAQIMCHKVDSSNSTGSRTTVPRSLDCDNGGSVSPVSDKIMEDPKNGVEMLVPCCQSHSGSLFECGSNNPKRERPLVADALTVLLLALPPDTWDCLKDSSLREEFCGIISTNNLSDLLQQEILHLRKQLHFLVADVCSSAT